MTDRLYYDDAYRKAFAGRVLACRADGEGYLIRLDQSAFYPTSGGQPYDTGTLGGARVTDVFVDAEGELWHRTDAPLEPGAHVEGKIDWARRFDHMQQHAGEHMLAGCIWKETGGHTTGLHLGAAFSTIDVDYPDGAMRLPEGVLNRIEDIVNAQIQDDLPIRSWFPGEEELKELPLRKPPTVKEHVRVVMVGAVECVACGGTHPSSSGQIGLLKILDARPCKGKMRVSFVAGARAVRDYRLRFQALDGAARLLSASAETLPDSVEAALEKIKALEGKIAAERLHGALIEARSLLETAPKLPGGGRLLSHAFNSLDAATLREAAAALIREEGLAVLLAGDAGDGAPLVFARSRDLVLPMGALLGRTVRPLGGKGGGREDFAQGAANGAAALRAAAQELMTEK